MYFNGKSCHRVNIGLVLLSGPSEEKSIVRYGGSHSVSAGQKIVPNRIGKEMNICASNWWAMMAS